MTTEEREAAFQQWLSDFKAGRFKKQRQSDVDALAHSLGVAPPPLPLSPEGQANAERILRDMEADKDVEADEEEESEDELSVTPTRRTILALAAWAEAQPWPGRSGATDHHAYRAFLDVAYRANTLVVGMSQYQLAELIGVSHTTAWRVIRRLERRRLLRPSKDQASVHKSVTHSSDEKPLSSSYLLIEQEGVHNRVTHTSTFLLNGYESHAYAQVPEAFWGRGGLSKAALRTYRLLDPTKGQAEKELAGKLSRNRSSVNRTLRQLAKLDLAQKTPGGWILGSADLEQVAETLATAGARERTRAYHEQLRAGYRGFLKHKTGSVHAEGSYPQDVQAREGTVVSETGTNLRADGGAAIPERGTEPLPSDHGRGVSSESVERLGHNPTDLLTDDRARQLVRGVGLDNQQQSREAACVDCGQVQTFSAPNLRPYSCAYCKGKFAFVDELAMVAA